MPTRCDACGSVSIARHGTGTERLESELEGNVFRLDGEVADPARVLAAFEAAPRGVLVGTQMVAKGHDFPDVDLGVVVDADATLRFPDFRAEERTFALVTQLAGRAGAGRRREAGSSSRPWRPTRRRSASRPPTTPTGSWPRSSSAAARCAIRPSRRSSASSARRRPPARRWRPRRPSARRLSDALGPAPLFRLRGRERAQVVVKAQDRDGGRGAGRRGGAGGRRGPRPSRRRVQRGRRPAVATLQWPWQSRMSRTSRSPRRRRRTSPRLSIRRSPRGATPRSRTCASSAIRC